MSTANCPSSSFPRSRRTVRRRLRLPPGRPARAGLARRPVGVAEAALGLDRRGVRRLWRELLPEIADVELDLLSGGALIPPDELEQLLVAENLIRVADEGSEQSELQRRQVDPHP